MKLSKKPFFCRYKSKAIFCAIIVLKTTERELLQLSPLIPVLIFRDHAVISYDHGQRTFFLQDVGSSNGSFVNNIRLSKAGQESRITRIYSGDVIR